MRKQPDLRQKANSVSRTNVAAPHTQFYFVRFDVNCSKIHADFYWNRQQNIMKNQ